MPRRLRATLWRYRALVAALCVGLAAWIVLAELRPPDPPSTPVLVAARTLPAGTALTADDLRTAHLAHAPAGAVDADLALGATLTIGVPEGLPLVETMLLGPGLSEAAPPGWVVVPVPLADPLLVELLRVGDRVDLYAAASELGGQPEDAQLITAGALVLARDGPNGSDEGWLAAPASPPDSIIVAIRGEDAGAVTGASATGAFHAVLSAP